MKRDVQLVLACLCVSVLAGILTQVGIANASRNASGTYSLPSGNPVVTGTTISSTTHNNTMSDLATEMTDSLNRSGKGAMLAALELVSSGGSVGTPALSFDGDENTGLYRIGADNPAMSAGGTKIQEWSTTTSTFPKGLVATQSTSNGDGITATGNGSGYGVVGVGGSSNGVGGSFTGGAGASNGVNGIATGAAAGVHGNGGSVGIGVYCTGNTTRAPLHIVPSAQPSTPTEGDIYGNSTDHKLYYYTGSAWVVVGTQT